MAFSGGMSSLLSFLRSIAAQHAAKKMNAKELHRFAAMPWLVTAFAARWRGSLFRQCVEVRFEAFPYHILRRFKEISSLQQLCQYSQFTDFRISVPFLVALRLWRRTEILQVIQRFGSPAYPTLVIPRRFG